ncbi:MAG: anhydro-N-acetylmuramic acid kinase, partial [Acidimicrobiia bacterium]
GLISGTSMDGIDVAAANFRLDGGVLRLTPLGDAAVAYSPDLRAALGAVLPPADTTVDAVCRLDNLVGREFAAAATVLEVTPDLVVSHGQTVFHWVEDGRVEGTFQIGNPAWIAEATGTAVLSDLRSADVAAGGQGAPLVGLFDVLLLGPGDEPRAALNLGGIANLTVVAPGADPVAFDAGPANALLDAAVARLSEGSENHDAGGRRAGRGRVDEALLAVLLDDPYYALPPPKTTGKERFHLGYLDAALACVPAPPGGDDLCATLTAHVAEVVAAACRRHAVMDVVASGGGTANPTLMAALADRLAPAALRTVDDLGLPSAAKEAYAFATLGFLAVHGLPGTLPSLTGARHPAVLGRLTAGPRPVPVAPGPVAMPARLVVEAHP